MSAFFYPLESTGKNYTFLGGTFHFGGQTISDFVLNALWRIILKIQYNTILIQYIKNEQNNYRILHLYLYTKGILQNTLYVFYVFLKFNVKIVRYFYSNLNLDIALQCRYKNQERPYR